MLAIRLFDINLAPGRRPLDPSPTTPLNPLRVTSNQFSAASKLPTTPPLPTRPAQASPSPQNLRIEIPACSADRHTKTAWMA